MDTPQDQLNSYRKAEEDERKYSRVDRDPQFSQMMDLMLTLHGKYGTKKLVGAIIQDYRNKWINLFSGRSD